MIFYIEAYGEKAFSVRFSGYDGGLIYRDEKCRPGQVRGSCLEWGQYSGLNVSGGSRPSVQGSPCGGWYCETMAGSVGIQGGVSRSRLNVPDHMFSHQSLTRCVIINNQSI